MVFTLALLLLRLATVPPQQVEDVWVKVEGHRRWLETNTSMPLVANETSNAYTNQIDKNLAMSSSNHKDRTEQETRVDVLNEDNIMVSLVASGESDVSSLGADSASNGVEVAA